MVKATAEGKQQQGSSRRKEQGRRGGMGVAGLARLRHECYRFREEVVCIRSFPRLQLRWPSLARLEIGNESSEEDDTAWDLSEVETFDSLPVLSKQEGTTQVYSGDLVEFLSQEPAASPLDSMPKGTVNADRRGGTKNNSERSQGDLDCSQEGGGAIQINQGCEDIERIAECMEDIEDEGTRKSQVPSDQTLAAEIEDKDCMPSHGLKEILDPWPNASYMEPKIWQDFSNGHILINDDTSPGARIAATTHFTANPHHKLHELSTLYSSHDNVRGHSDEFKLVGFPGLNVCDTACQQQTELWNEEVLCSNFESLICSSPQPNGFPCMDVRNQISTPIAIGLLEDGGVMCAETYDKVQANPRMHLLSSLPSNCSSGIDCECEEVQTRLYLKDEGKAEMQQINKQMNSPSDRTAFSGMDKFAKLGLGSTRDSAIAAQIATRIKDALERLGDKRKQGSWSKTTDNKIGGPSLPITKDANNVNHASSDGKVPEIDVTKDTVMSPAGLWDEKSENRRLESHFLYPRSQAQNLSHLGQKIVDARADTFNQTEFVIPEEPDLYLQRVIAALQLGNDVLVKETSQETPTCAAGVAVEEDGSLLQRQAVRTKRSSSEVHLTGSSFNSGEVSKLDVVHGPGMHNCTPSAVMAQTLERKLPGNVGTSTDESLHGACHAESVFEDRYENRPAFSVGINAPAGSFVGVELRGHSSMQDRQDETNFRDVDTSHSHANLSSYHHARPSYAPATAHAPVPAHQGLLDVESAHPQSKVCYERNLQKSAFEQEMAKGQQARHIEESRPRTFNLSPKFPRTVRSSNHEDRLPSFDKKIATLVEKANQLQQGTNIEDNCNSRLASPGLLQRESEVTGVKRQPGLSPTKLSEVRRAQRSILKPSTTAKALDAKPHDMYHCHESQASETAKKLQDFGAAAESLAHELNALMTNRRPEINLESRAQNCRKVVWASPEVQEVSPRQTVKQRKMQRLERPGSPKPPLPRGNKHPKVDDALPSAVQNMTIIGNTNEPLKGQVLIQPGAPQHPCTSKQMSGDKFIKLADGAVTPAQTWSKVGKTSMHHGSNQKTQQSSAAQERGLQRALEIIDGLAGENVDRTVFRQELRELQAETKKLEMLVNRMPSINTSLLEKKHHPLAVPLQKGNTQEVSLGTLEQNVKPCMASAARDPSVVGKKKRDRNAISPVRESDKKLIKSNAGRCSFSESQPFHPEDLHDSDMGDRILSSTGQQQSQQFAVNYTLNGENSFREWVSDGLGSIQDASSGSKPATKNTIKTKSAQQKPKDALCTTQTVISTLLERMMQAMPLNHPPQPLQREIRGRRVVRPLIRKVNLRPPGTTLKLCKVGKAPPDDTTGTKPILESHPPVAGQEKPGGGPTLHERKAMKESFTSRPNDDGGVQNVSDNCQQNVETPVGELCQPDICPQDECQDTNHHGTSGSETLPSKNLAFASTEEVLKETSWGMKSNLLKHEVEVPTTRITSMNDGKIENGNCQLEVGEKPEAQMVQDVDFKSDQGDSWSGSLESIFKAYKAAKGSALFMLSPSHDGRESRELFGSGFDNGDNKHLDAETKKLKTERLLGKKEKLIPVTSLEKDDKYEVQELELRRAHKAYIKSKQKSFRSTGLLVGKDKSQGQMTKRGFQKGELKVPNVIYRTARLGPNRRDDWDFSTEISRDRCGTDQKAQVRDVAQALIKKILKGELKSKQTRHRVKKLQPLKALEVDSRRKRKDTDDLEMYASTLNLLKVKDKPTFIKMPHAREGRKGSNERQPIVDDIRTNHSATLNSIKRKSKESLNYLRVKRNELDTENHVLDEVTMSFKKTRDLSSPHTSESGGKLMNEDVRESIEHWLDTSGGFEFLDNYDRIGEDDIFDVQASASSTQRKASSSMAACVGISDMGFSDEARQDQTTILSSDIERHKISRSGTEASHQSEKVPQLNYADEVQLLYRRGASLQEVSRWPAQRADTAPTGGGFSNSSITHQQTQVSLGELIQVGPQGYDTTICETDQLPYVLSQNAEEKLTEDEELEIALLEIVLHTILKDDPVKVRDVADKLQQQTSSAPAESRSSSSHDSGGAMKVPEEQPAAFSRTVGLTCASQFTPPLVIGEQTLMVIEDQRGRDVNLGDQGEQMPAANVLSLGSATEEQASGSAKSSNGDWPEYQCLADMESGSESCEEDFHEYKIVDEQEIALASHQGALGEVPFEQISTSSTSELDTGQVLPSKALPPQEVAVTTHPPYSAVHSMRAAERQAIDFPGIASLAFGYPSTQPPPVKAPGQTLVERSSVSVQTAEMGVTQPPPLGPSVFPSVFVVPFYCLTDGRPMLPTYSMYPLPFSAANGPSHLSSVPIAVQHCPQISTSPNAPDLRGIIPMFPPPFMSTESCPKPEGPSQTSTMPVAPNEQHDLRAPASSTASDHAPVPAEVNVFPAHPTHCPTSEGPSPPCTIPMVSAVQNGLRTLALTATPLRRAPTFGKVSSSHLRRLSVHINELDILPNLCSDKSDSISSSDSCRSSPTTPSTYVSSPEHAARVASALTFTLRSIQGPVRHIFPDALNEAELDSKEEVYEHTEDLEAQPEDRSSLCKRKEEERLLQSLSADNYYNLSRVELEVPALFSNPTHEASSSTSEKLESRTSASANSARSTVLAASYDGSGSSEGAVKHLKSRTFQTFSPRWSLEDSKLFGCIGPKSAGQVAVTQTSSWFSGEIRGSLQLPSRAAHGIHVNLKRNFTSQTLVSSEGEVEPGEMPSEGECFCVYPRPSCSRQSLLLGRSREGRDIGSELGEIAGCAQATQLPSLTSEGPGRSSQCLSEGELKAGTLTEPGEVSMK